MRPSDASPICLISAIFIEIVLSAECGKINEMKSCNRHAQKCADENSYYFQFFYSFCAKITYANSALHIFATLVFIVVYESCIVNV